MNCPCGNKTPYEECCGPFLSGKALPESAEKLMRSRYTAYTRVNVDYIKNTLAPESRSDFDPKAAREWGEKAKWHGLQIISTDKGTTTDKTGTVEFIATYEMEGDAVDHHEVSQFRKDQKGQWFFVDGESHTHKAGEGHQDHHHEPQKPVVREAPKTGRNDPCPCGSGKKNKKCCAA